MQTQIQVQPLTKSQTDDSYTVEISCPILKQPIDINRFAKDSIFDAIDVAKMSNGTQDCMVFDSEGKKIGLYTIEWTLVA
jgi:hypothetical protein